MYYNLSILLSSYFLQLLPFYFFILLFNYPLSLSLLAGTPLHAMDCTDIVIATARGNRYRVFDYYTRDRSTPRLDEFYGGTQGIIGAVGKEENGVTTIKFWKRLTSSKNLHKVTCVLFCMVDI